jgi:transposase
MIVIGVGAHKRTHTLVALDAVTGASRGERTIQASDDGVLNGLRFAVALDGDHVWAVADWRHVTSRLERALLGAGERVIRVPPALTGDSRKASRTPGKSDPIEARAVALAAIREGVENLPVAFLDEQAHEIRVHVLQKRLAGAARAQQALIQPRRSLHPVQVMVAIQRHHRLQPDGDRLFREPRPT